MTPDRFQAITRHYRRLRIAVIGDFCLDRYLEIDPARKETSIETGLPVHNVVRVRSQPGGAGTILNNLVALGIGTLYPVGFHGPDGEGFELKRCLESIPQVQPEHFIGTDQRRTFTYTKPLLIKPGEPPEELNRLDFKNWSPTPPEVQAAIRNQIEQLTAHVDACILLDQVDVPETGVITADLLRFIKQLTREHPGLLFLADSRRGLSGYPPVALKMNLAELARMCGCKSDLDVEQAEQLARQLTAERGKPVFVTMAEQGILGASPKGECRRVPAFPVNGPIDIVGAGDAVTANLTVALIAGADLTEALELANAAASVVVHQLGTTGTATVEQLKHSLLS